MSTQTPNSVSSSQLDASVFRRLSLLMHECRTEKIRSAIRKQAALVHRAATRWKPHRVDNQLSLLVTSGYRLLDPRFRSLGVERVQLAYPLERLEEEVPVLPPLALLQPPRRLTPSDDPIASNLVELVELVDQAVGQPTSAPSNNRSSSEQPADEDDSLEVRKELVRLIRAEEQNDNEGWRSIWGKWWVGGSSGLILMLAFLGLSRSLMTPAQAPPLDVIQSNLLEEANASIPLDLASAHQSTEPIAS